MTPARVVKVGASIQGLSQRIVDDLNARIQGAAATGFDLGALFAADAIAKGATPEQIKAAALGKAPPLKELPEDAPIWIDLREVKKCGSGGHVQVPGSLTGKKAKVVVLR